MGDTSVAIRLGTTGAADVKRDLTGIGDEGEAQAKRWSREWEKAGDAILDGVQKQARASAKLAALMPGTPTQQIYQAGASTNFDGPSTRETAAAMRELYAEQDRLDAKARALTATMDPLRVAQDRYTASMADLVKLHDRGRISLELFLAEEQKEAAILEKVAGAARDAAAETKALDAMRAGQSKVTKVNPETIVVGKSASVSGAAFEELLPVQEKQAAAAEALRAKIDPLYGAQKRFDDEVKRASELADAAAISETEHAAAVALAEKELNEAKRALHEHSNALGLNRAQFITAQSAVMRFSDSVMAGQSPLRAFALEAHKLGEVVSMDDGGVAGGLAKLRALITPVNVGIAAGATITIAAVAALVAYNEAVEKLSALAAGSGVVLAESGQQLEANAEAASAAGNETVAAAREIEQAYLGVARSGDVLVQMTANTRDFAAATGQDAKQASAQMAAIFEDPIKGAQELAEKYGALSDAQVEHIAKLVEEGHETEAQTEINQAVQKAFSGAAEKADAYAASLHDIAVQATDAYSAVGRFLGSNFGVGQQGLITRLTGWHLPGQPVEAADDGDERRKTAFRARGDELVRGYEGDNRASIRRTLGQLQDAIKSGGTPSELNAWTEALAANEHALNTWKPAAEKANDIAAAREKFRQAKTPKDRAAARSNLLMAQASGEIVTQANIMLRAADAEAGFHNRGSKGALKHAETLAREAESMEVSARAAIDVANAYLTSSDAGLVAEGRRKAATDATRKGISIEAQAERQMALAAADQIAAAAKSAAALGDEAAARDAVMAKVKDGTIAANDMDEALKVELAIRPLLAARAHLHGDALTALNRTIDATTAALERSTIAAGKFDIANQIESSRQAAIELGAQLDDVGKSPLDVAINAAGRGASAASDKAHLRFDDPERMDLYHQKVGEAEAGYNLNKGRFVQSTVDSQADALVISQRALELAGANDNYRTQELDKLKLSLEIRRQFPDLAQADVAGLLAGVEAQDKVNAKLKMTSTAMGELSNIGSSIADTMLSPDSWRNWGNAGRSVLKDLESEFIKLTLLNPLKNMLNGNSDLPTASSVIGSLFGGGSSTTISRSSVDDMLQSTLDSMGHNASGTADWSGGRTWINENGPEIADLPNGTRIYPAADSRRMMQAANENSGGRSRLDIHLNTPLFTATVSDTADSRIGMAAPAIVAGGAQMGNTNAARARRRQLGTRG